MGGRAKDSRLARNLRALVVYASFLFLVGARSWESLPIALKGSKALKAGLALRPAGALRCARIIELRIVEQMS